MLKTFYKNLNNDIFFVSVFIGQNDVSVLSGEVSTLPLLNGMLQAKDENGEYIVRFNGLTVYNLSTSFDDISSRIADMVADEHYVDFFKPVKTEEYFQGISFHAFHKEELEERLTKEINNIDKNLKVIITRTEEYV